MYKAVAGEYQSTNHCDDWQLGMAKELEQRPNVLIELPPKSGSKSGPFVLALTAALC
jgi:hypothetical protein